MLLTHLYEYFGVLLGCSMQGGADYPAYDGDASQYETHKFMDLSHAEVTYFINQVALSAMSFGVAKEDLAVVGTALMNTFGYKCEMPITVIPSQGAQLQSVCSGPDCPLAANSSCPTTNITEPAVANASLVPSVTASGTVKPTGAATSPAATKSTGAAAAVGMSFAAVAGGLAALFL